ncbi:MAG: type II toxin-antitoxin system HicA family toxin [Nitrososphaerota archaeon]|nr:type II toxin-antitoxin system HicA family toxin [Nitrososphaerota archaeon]MDG7020216.1 type II toxin-antitoxin system HicA family toxin [Nitrososphaerota archaeon]MDG7028360.1 type II toxin-antitoxin system HicA family toxin [Nitrososphaerota archaeon]
MRQGFYPRWGYVDHQTGSHIIMRQKEEPHRRVTVPRHSELAKGTLRAIICRPLSLLAVVELLHGDRLDAEAGASHMPARPNLTGGERTGCGQGHP